VTIVGERAAGGSSWFMRPGLEAGTVIELR
jgi:hypothetical protein